jgi:hypothetical protein
VLAPSLITQQLPIIPTYIAKPFGMHARLFALSADRLREVVVVWLVGIRTGKDSFASAVYRPQRHSVLFT